MIIKKCPFRGSVEMCCKYYSFDLIIALAYLNKKKLYMSVVTHNLTYIEKGHSFAADCNIAKVI